MWTRDFNTDSKITKQEAASRQLQTAIVLFFCDDDTISVHVLASAASQILYDVCGHLDHTSFRDKLEDYIVDEFKKDWRVLMKKAYNYFKHAKDDPFDELEQFDANSNKFLIWGACVDYCTAYTIKEAPHEIISYIAWFIATHPNMMRRDHPLTTIIREAPSFNGLGDKSPDQQRQWAADMLRSVYEKLGQRPPVTGLRTDDPVTGVCSEPKRLREYW
jgi:hypothetical protein